jgi:cysteine-rich repeat protein
MGHLVEFGDIEVGSNGTMTFENYDNGDSDWTNDYGVTLNLDNLGIESGGRIAADDLGYTSERGPGYGNDGAAHGGYGWSNPAEPYGDVYEPVNLGSGSGGHSGGGAMKIVVSETLDNDGVISANVTGSTDNHGHSGSGGSIWIDTKTISGGGAITVNGGNTHCDGGDPGSGGRIAVYYDNDNSEILNTLGAGSPVVTAYGGYAGSCAGYSARRAGAGTVYVEDKVNNSNKTGDLYIDNAGQVNASNGMDFEAQDYTFNDVYIGNNVKLKMKGDKSTLPDGVEYPPMPEAHPIESDEDTVGLWNMDEGSDNTCSGGEDVCDSSGEGNHGTFYGNAAFTSSAKLGSYAVTFDGSGDYVNVGDSSSLDNLSVMTLEAWIYPVSISGANRVIVSKRGIDSIAPFHYYLNSSNSTLCLRINTSAYCSANAISPNEWTYVVATYDNSSINLYLEGVENISHSYSAAIPSNDRVVQIGWREGSNEYFNGTIDEVAIYNRVLTTKEIEAHYYGLSLEEYEAYLQEWNNIDGQKIGRGVTFDLTGDFTVGEGAYLDGDVQGFGSDVGHGKGMKGGDTGGGQGSGGGGGGHGGSGGIGEDDGINGETDGGEGYDSAVRPFNLGSGGGESGAGAVGGAGGGAVAITTEDGTITIDGIISVNGGDGMYASPGGGGGAGGSIYLRGDEIIIGATGLLSAIGGDGGDDGSTYVGGGGGGGLIVLVFGTNILGAVEDVTVLKDEGSGYQSGGEGVYGDYGIPELYLQDQYTKSDEAIPVGGEIDERAVKFKLNVADPDANDSLSPQIEVVEAGDGNSFDETNVITGGSVVWTGGDPVDLETIIQNSNEQGMVDSRVLGIAAMDLTWGEEYKWRGRVIDGNGVASEWVDYGDNGDGTDFQIASVPTCNNGVKEFGEECDGTDFGAETCVTRGYTGGDLTCSETCTIEDTCWECGNGIIEAGNGEQCDEPDLGVLTCTWFDEFNAGTIGCNDSCQYDTSGCRKDPVCGNSVVEPGEQCDDGNTSSGDGCSDSCIIEGYGGYCGDGTVQSGEGEECDDGNNISGDGCSNVCMNETEGYCGDGIQQESEQCDDGNQVSGDGCSNVCINETDGYCGDGVQQESEQCDDGNQESGDGCSNVCSVEDGVCGNGILERGEQCDGTELNDQGCSDIDDFTGGALTCTQECTFDTNMCTKNAVCGNGVVEPGEQCDGDIGRRSCKDFYGFIGGRLSCSDECIYELEDCIAEGEIRTLFGLPLTGTVRTIAQIAFGGLSFIGGVISLILAFPSLLFRREKKPWGLVYDIDLDKPIAFVIVRLFTGKKLVAQKVTDLQGRYGFAVSDGKYRLEVEHENYEKKEIKVEMNGKVEGSVNQDIGLVSRKAAKFNLKRWIKTKLANARDLFPRVSRYTYIFGLIFSIVATIFSPVLYNYLVIVFYIVVLIVYILLGIKRGLGRVYDSKTNKGIGGAFVRVFDTKDNKLIDNQMSDESGKYMFVVKEGKYNLLASKKGYAFPSKKENKKLKKTFYGSLIEVVIEKGKTLGVDLAMDPISREVIDKARLEGKEKVVKFGSPFSA